MDERVLIAEVLQEESGLAPGEFRICDGRMFIQTGSGQIIPCEVQIEGKRRMAIADFLRGYKIKNNSLT